MIDSHHHVWDTAVRDHAWLADLPQIDRSFGLADLRPLAEEAGVSGTVLVQVLGQVAETYEFLALAAGDPLVRGVVGWVDLTDPGVGDTLAALRTAEGGHRLVGVRHLVQDERDHEWLLRPDVGRGVAATGRSGLVYDLLITPQHLEVAATLTGNLTDVSFVVDHMAKPQIAAGEIDRWATGIHRLAERPNVACKVSGILTEAGGDWSVATLLPYVQVVVDAFGADRLMIGSDWPVSLLATDYRTVLFTLVQTLESAGLTPDELVQVTSGTAERWYRLPAA